MVFDTLLFVWLHGLTFVRSRQDFLEFYFKNVTSLAMNAIHLPSLVGFISRVGVRNDTFVYKQQNAQVQKKRDGSM
jgi:hypothetical protein